MTHPAEHVYFQWAVGWRDAEPSNLWEVSKGAGSNGKGRKGSDHGQNNPENDLLSSATVWVGGEGCFARGANKDQKVGLEDGGFPCMVFLLGLGDLLRLIAYLATPSQSGRNPQFR